MVTKVVKEFLKNIFFPEPSRPPFYHICQVGDPLLRMCASDVSINELDSSYIQNIVSQLTSVMRNYKSEGLSAPQIGIPLRIFAMESTKITRKNTKLEIYTSREMSEFPLTIFINPVMKVLNYEKSTFTEACESVCGFSANVSRYKSVKIEGYNPLGDYISHDFHGWLARIAQHEMDHLSGKLYIDNMDISTFQNDAWHKINIYCGRVQLRFDGRKVKSKS